MIRDNENYAPEDYPPDTVVVALIEGKPVLALRRLCIDAEYPLYDWAHSLHAGRTCSHDSEVDPIQTLVSPQHNTIPEEKQ
jgi:hypothetical protein